MSPKNVLLSHLAIPSDSIGSWNVLFTNLIRDNNKVFDYIISPKTTSKFNYTINHFEIKNKRSSRMNRFIKYYDKIDYWNCIKEILKKETYIVINIIDNIGLLLAINYFAKKYNLRKKIYINFFLRGYNFDVSIERRKEIYLAIDKLILMSNSSYQFQLQNNHTLAPNVRILQNGVNSNNFYPITKTDKEKKRIELGFNPDKIYFIWLSQDRPKKGLDLMLKVWKELIKKFSNIELLIIGSNRKFDDNQVTNLGRINNADLAQYYQISDYYLFSTLCHEGHPLSLTEAFKCGLTCFASNIDPVSEVLKEGELGILIDLPHFKENWISAISKELTEKSFKFNESLDLKDIYSFNTWKKEIEVIFEESKQNFQKYN